MVTAIVVAGGKCRETGRVIEAGVFAYITSATAATVNPARGGSQCFGYIGAAAVYMAPIPVLVANIICQLSPLRITWNMPASWTNALNSTGVGTAGR